MQQSLFWQNPHVDVFKFFKILDLKQNIEQKGKVSIVHEKELGSKKVIKIEGSNSSASFLRFPSKQSRINSLGLVGNFKQNDLSLQIPITENPNEWSILGIDSKSYLSHLKEIKEGQDYQIKSFELCPNMRLKNIYTSDNLYCPHSLPKDFMFSQNAKYKFLDKHKFIMLGDKTWQENHSNQQQQNEENQENQDIKPTKAKSQTDKYGKQYLKSILKSKDPNSVQEKSHIVKIKQEKLNEETPRIEPKPFVLEDRSALTKKQQQVQKKPDFQLLPAPIMQLQHVQGFTGGMKNLVYFGNNQIIYSSGNIMIMMDLKTRVQKYFFGQQSDINNIVANKKHNIIVSTDQTQISIWNAETLLRTGFYYTGYSQIISLDICISNKSLYVVLTALDNQRRPAIMILQNDQILVKQLSDFDVQRVQFISQIDFDQGFITCGKESIRYWKVKKTFDKDFVLQGHSVFLGEHTRDSVFNDLVVQQESKKALIVSNQGNLYIVDNNKKEIVGVYRIHEEDCKTIQIYQVNQQLQKDSDKQLNQHQEEFIITGDKVGKIKIWSTDFTDVLLEVQLDSQVSCISIFDENLILCGCLNGTLGILDRKKKMLNFLVRSHNDDVIMLKYHQHARKLITISSDYTIRIWEILGSQMTLFFSEVYEFRCIDDQVSTIQCFHKKEKIICGFESGNIRVFDIQNYQICNELDFHKSRVTSIALNFNDQTGISADESGKISLFNEELEQTKEKNTDRMSNNVQVGFSFRGDLYYILEDQFNLKIYSLQSDAVKFWVSTQEKITNVTFSNQREDFFVLTEKGKIKKYKLNENTNNISLYRQYAAMHDGNIHSITPSNNCNYLFTTGDDKLLKIWDYHFRGGLQPAFQAYNCGEELNQIELTNDDLNLVLSFGQKSRTLFCWKFNQSLYEWDEENEYKSQAGDQEVEVDQVSQANVFSNLTKTIVHGNYTEKQEENIPQEIQSIYKEEERIFNMQNQQQQQQEERKEDKYQQIQQNYQDEPQDQQQQNDNQAQNNNNNEIQKDEILPGEYFQKQYIIGFDTDIQFPQQTFIWNKQENHYILTVNNSVIVNNLSEERHQKIFQETYKTQHLHLSPNNKYFVYALKNKKGTIKVIDSKNLKQIKEIKHNFIDKLQQITISPCSNYLLTITTLNAEKYPFITIFELATGKVISCSQMVKADFVMSRWDCSQLGQLEFCVLSKESVFFYRLNNRSSLEYIESALDQGQKGQFGQLYCCEYMELQDKNVLLVGSQMGALLIYDLNTGGLLCICKSIINGPITYIQCSSDHLTILSSNVNINNWNFSSLPKKNNKIEFQYFAQQFEEKPEIIQLDAVIGYISQKQLDDTGDIMVITRQGILWLIDLNDQGTLRMNCSHVSQRTISQIKYVINDPKNYHNGLLFSAANDFTLKLFNMGHNEIRTEFYAPKKECISFDVFEQLQIVVGGFSDGYLRFFDYQDKLSLGVVALIDQQSNQTYPITSVQCIPQTKNVLAGNSNGDIFIVYISNLDKNRFKIDINRIVDNVGFCINQISISFLDSLDLWLITTQNGKIMVWNRKCLRRNVNPQEELAHIYDLEYYLTDNYKISKYQPLQSERAPEKTYYDNVCRAEFSKDEREIYFAINKHQKEVIMRNFREHVNVKSIPIKYNPLYLQLGYKNDILVITDTEGGINLYDYRSGIELDRENIGQQQIQCVQLLDIRHQLPDYEYLDRNDPNQPFPPYLITASNNQINVYSAFI